ncbi:hypothetical protein EDC01DRAFT_648131 [Geopyxis carbonaria]|nr:hypothetical protein EDC01DRAFT_648131 [Geopyxis carbonaria]
MCPHFIALFNLHPILSSALSSIVRLAYPPPLRRRADPQTTTASATSPRLPADPPRTPRGALAPSLRQILGPHTFRPAERAREERNNRGRRVWRGKQWIQEISQKL